MAIGPDVTHFEGNSGTVDYVFPITLSQSPLLPVTVAYTTQDISAMAGSDYLPQSATLTFTPGGATSANITVQVLGDLVPEANETFRVQITNVGGGILGRSAAIGTILNDDVDLTINDISVIEGNQGTSNAVFTVSAIGAVNESFSVNWATNDGTAHAGSDYLAGAGVVSFVPGVQSRPITVPIVGDLINEATENFFVNLSNPLGDFQLIKSTGICTIIDTDPVPDLYVNDVHVTTTQAGTLAAVFTVALDLFSGQTVTVQYATADGTAVAGTNYTPTSGTMTFFPGLTTQQLTVPVMTSSTYASNEHFYLNLSNPVHATLADSQGVGTIIFAPPPVQEYIIDDGDPGFSTTGGYWTNVTNTLAYQLDYDYHPPGTDGAAATWTFSHIPTDAYQVFVKWIPFSNRATNAPYTILDGSTPITTVAVNQQVMPSGDLENNVVWQSLGKFNTSTGTLVVRLSDNANGYVVADAVRIVEGSSVPRKHRGRRGRRRRVDRRRFVHA